MFKLQPIRNKNCSWQYVFLLEDNDMKNFVRTSHTLLVSTNKSFELQASEKFFYSVEPIRTMNFPCMKSS
jgi:hypothetical protein